MSAEARGPAGPPLRVVALSRGRDVPSARFRVRQYVVPLQAHGVELVEHVPRRPAHLLVGRGQAGALAHALLWRKRALAASHRADVTLLQRELVSTYATLEGWTGRPRVFDVDDAVHLHRGGAAGRAVERIVRRCDLVVAGNESLAAWYRARAPRVEVLATPVDTQAYQPGPEPGGPLVVGWMGTSSNGPALASVQEGLRRFLLDRPDARLRIVSDRPIALPRVPAGQLEFSPWSAGREAADLRSFHVGLMPLEDTPWNRGKCAFKMLLYMAAGRPVVVSPVGFNNDVLAHGEVGLAASSSADWAEALSRLAADPALRQDLGRKGREVSERSFDTRVLAGRLAGFLRSVAA